MRSFLVFLVLLLARAEGGPCERILFTGKLLGYTRVPDVQRLRLSTEGVPQALEGKRLYRDASDGPASRLATVLSEQIRERRCEDGLLLGMGDNFAMEFLSRVMVQPKAGGGFAYIPKDELFYHPAGYWLDMNEVSSREDRAWASMAEAQFAGNTTIPSDNVATFFIQNRYDALTLGKHDFYYGPERLRQLARLLAARGVQMLGANVVIRSTRADGVAAKPEVLRRADWEQHYLVELEGLEWRIPKAVLPWVRRFALRGSRAFSGARLCRQERPDGPLSECRELVVSKNELRLPDGDGALPSESSYAVCVDVDGVAKPFCKVFEVQSPYLQYPDEAQRTRRPREGQDTKVRPYVVRGDRVIFGVVALGLERQVGVLNTHWINRNEAFDTFVTTVDPLEALEQLIDYCKAQGDCRAGSRYVLMAQMPRDGAESLGRRVRARHPLEVVVSQADDRFATAVQPVTYAAGHPTVTLTPREVLDTDAERPYRFGLQEAEFRGGALTTSAVPAVEFGSDTPGKNACLAPLFAKAWMRVTGVRPPDALDEEHVRTVVLAAMRKHKNASVALLQHRDLFQAKRLLAACPEQADGVDPVAAAIDLLLWKGDFVMTRALRGSSLKAALRESRRLKDLEDDIYSNESESGRWLETFGIVADPKRRDTWYVNGEVIDDRLIYSVAMTDFLAFGDTGYPDLRDVAAPPDVRVRELGYLPRVAEVTLEELGRGEAGESLNLATYQDHTEHVPFAIAPRAEGLDLFRGRVDETLRTRQPALPAGAHGARAGMMRAYWRVFLEKGEFGFSDYSHNQGTQDRLRSRFGGIPEGGVLNRIRQAISSAVQFEVRRDAPRAQYFFRVEEEFTAERTQQDGALGLLLQNYPQNLISGETGLRLAFPSNRQRPWQGMVVSFQASSQVRSPFEDLAVGVRDCVAAPGGPPCPSTVPLRDRTSRTSRYLSKLGYRWEGRQSWVEAGTFYGTVLRPVGFGLVSPGESLGAVCRLAELGSRETGLRSTLARCIQGRFFHSVPDPARVTLPDLRLRTENAFNAERGVFLNFNLRLPLPHLRQVEHLVVENRGRLFFNTATDTVLDTRLSNRLSIGPTVRVLPGMNFKPLYTVFVYRNRVTRNFLSGRTFELRLEYRFNKESGVSWRQALKAGWPR